VRVEDDELLYWYLYEYLGHEELYRDVLSDLEDDLGDRDEVG